MSKPIESAWPPVLRSLFGEKFIGGGDVWLSVPPETTNGDVNKYVVWSGKGTAADVHGKRLVEPDIWCTVVTGSKGDKYTVSLKQDQWTCECAGFGFRRKCKHIAQAKEVYVRR